MSASFMSGKSAHMFSTIRVSASSSHLNIQFVLEIARVVIKLCLRSYLQFAMQHHFFGNLHVYRGQLVLIAEYSQMSPTKFIAFESLAERKNAAYHLLPNANRVRRVIKVVGHHVVDETFMGQLIEAGLYLVTLPHSFCWHPPQTARSKSSCVWSTDGRETKRPSDNRSPFDTVCNVTCILLESKLRAQFRSQMQRDDCYHFGYSSFGGSRWP